MYNETKAMLGKGQVSGALSRDGIVEYWMSERGTVRAYRYDPAQKTADGIGKLVGYADAYVENDRAAAYRRGALIAMENE